MAAGIRAEGVTFGYGEEAVLRDLSLEVRRGEVLSILGSNGCGKTTLLRCLQGELRPAQGRILLEGRDLASLTTAERARRIGMVFQDHSALFSYTVLEVVRMGRAPHLGFFARPGARDTQIAERALERVGLARLRDKAYTQISGGERQLVLIARTLAQEPQVVLLDEPTSHLDFRNQLLVLSIMDRLSHEGLSIVLTSHSPNQAFLFSSRIGLMVRGAFHAVGTPEAVVNPENLRAIYGIEVRLLSAEDPESGRQVKFCVPARTRRDGLANLA